MSYPNHSFHIPVMGLAFTVNTPVKVAPYGIASVISIVEDNLLERMREYYYHQLNELYIPILNIDFDHRAKRITDYLNLVNRLVHEKVETIKSKAFEKGQEIVKYFEMLPEGCTLKKLYNSMLEMKDAYQKEQLQEKLRSLIKPGSIDVNIMTKLDNNAYDKNGDIIEDGSDALTALRGYATSNLTNSAIIFSAGMNPRLYNYLEKFEQFRVSKNGVFEKKIIIKVSDYRSALIQGKYLAKKGLWVSEFRIESGLNCGGHAFASDGYLLGPILEEFKNRKAQMFDELFTLYCKALQEKNREVPTEIPHTRITVQGGIGTAEEDNFLRDYYEVDGTGWGSPFLLVPEATTVDADTLKRLCNAKEEDIILSKNSPLGVRFNYLKGNSGEVEKLKRIEAGSHGSPCPERFLQNNTEFTERPICTASSKYQKLKLAELETLGLPDDELQKQKDMVLTKECLCLGLSNTATNCNITKPLLKTATGVSICPGPNIAYFNKIVSLQTMVNHIYGRTNIMESVDRPNMFQKEIELYIEYFEELVEENFGKNDVKKEKHIHSFYKNLLEGIQHYRNLINDSLFFKDAVFLEKLDVYELMLSNILEPETI